MSRPPTGDERRLPCAAPTPERREPVTYRSQELAYLMYLCDIGRLFLPRCQACGMTEAEGYVDQSVMGLAEPQPMYKILRESTPVFRSPQAVVLSRLADIEMALKHTELFSSNMDAVDLGNIRPLIPLQVDPPEHAKYRRILDPLFTPREMARREPQVAELVNEMIDRFADRGECDFHEEFAVPLPCTVFLQLLGLPLEDLDKFLEWKDGVIRPEGDSGFARRHETSAPVAQQIYHYFDR